MVKTNKFLITTLAFVLSLIVLISTSGFSVYSHHCSSNNIHNYSVLVPAKACSHHAEKQQHKSCCEQLKVTSENDDCCSDQEHVVKLETNILINYSVPVLKVYGLDLLFNSIANTNVAFGTVLNVTQLQLASKSPPPKPVSEYLSLIQVFLI